MRDDAKNVAEIERILADTFRAATFPTDVSSSKFQAIAVWSTRITCLFVVLTLAVALLAGLLGQVHSPLFNGIFAVVGVIAIGSLVIAIFAWICKLIDLAITSHRHRRYRTIFNQKPVYAELSCIEVLKRDFKRPNLLYVLEQARSQRTFLLRFYSIVTAVLVFAVNPVVSKYLGNVPSDTFETIIVTYWQLGVYLLLLLVLLLLVLQNPLTRYERIAYLLKLATTNDDSTR